MAIELIEKEFKFGAKNYLPLPMVMVKAKGPHMWDDQGNKYLDFVSAYSAVSLGHCNPRLIKAFYHQAKTLDVTSRAFHNDKLPVFLELLTHLTGFEKALPMNSGAEAVETALKIARKWGEKVKNIPKNKGMIVCFENNFHGRTLGAVSLSSDPQYQDGFGPFLPNICKLPFGDIRQFEAVLNQNASHICGVILEPIQGEAGIIVPPKGFLKQVEALCKQNNILLIVDEIQTGLYRTGKLFCHQHDEINPDMVCVGKALGGGIYPVSAVLTQNSIMDVITPGDHGSTFGGNPIACSIAIEALKIMVEKDLSKSVSHKGEFLEAYLRKNLKGNPLVKEIRGKGLFFGIEFTAELPAKTVVKKLVKKGLLTKDTHESTIRLAPSLLISKKELKRGLDILIKTLDEILNEHENLS